MIHTPYWYIRQIKDEQEAKNLLEWYRQRKLEALMFRNTFMHGYLVASYAEDDIHCRASREVGLRTFQDGYLGFERLIECLMYHELIDAGTSTFGVEGSEQGKG